MFFFLSKTVAFFISPLTWILVLLIAAWIIKRPALRKKLFVWSVILLLVFSNPFLRSFAFKQWEIPATRISEIKQPYDVGILMGGAMRFYHEESGRLVYGNSVDRLIQAMTLYREGKIRKILVTGGSGFLFSQDIKEAIYLKKVLLRFSIPENDILIESGSRNTYENAVYSTALLKERFPGGKFLLITSGYHMRRSLACFRKAGLHPWAFSVDTYTGKTLYTPDRIFLPGTVHLQAWDILLHEIAGYSAYKLAGYL